jgi:hypothetical protein
MDKLFKLAAWALIESGKAGNARAATIRMTVVAVCAGLAAVLMLGALGCAATALWIFALPSLGPSGAPLFVAASLLTFALCLAASGWIVVRHGRRKSVIAETPQLLLDEAARLFNDHKGVVLLAAMVAGMAAANGGRRS